MRRSRLGSPPITPKEEYPSTQLQDRKGCIMVLFNLGVHSGPDHCQEGTLIPPPSQEGGEGRVHFSGRPCRPTPLPGEKHSTCIALLFWLLSRTMNFISSPSTPFGFTYGYLGIRAPPQTKAEERAQIDLFNTLYDLGAWVPWFGRCAVIWFWPKAAGATCSGE